MVRAPIRSTGSSVLVDVLVVPNASRSCVVGLHGDRVKIRVTAAPERGKANKAVAELLRDATGASRVEVASGHGSRTKLIEIWGVGLGTVEERLLEEP